MKLSPFVCSLTAASVCTSEAKMLIWLHTLVGKYYIILWIETVYQHVSDGVRAVLCDWFIEKLTDRIENLWLLQLLSFLYTQGSKAVFNIGALLFNPSFNMDICDFEYKWNPPIGSIPVLSILT